MAKDPPTCSLSSPDLEQRLAEIAEVGSSSLISRKVEDGQHLLRFQPDDGTRRKLEGIVAAEAKCCSFLDLTLRKVEGELVLSILAPHDAQALAEGLATAFAAQTD